VAVADGLGATVPLYVPENGFIGINVPLVPARAGSLSTRTTHPFFLTQLRAVLDRIGVTHPVENPYRLRTKGEVLCDCDDPALIAELAPLSLSCAHPTAARWRRRAQGNCGYCWPCLIRRASMHAVGQDTPDAYAWDAMTDDELLEPSNDTGSSLRALLASMTEPADRYAVLRNGPIPGGEAASYDDVYRRGRSELRSWLEARGSATIRARLAAA